jgi:hypothetical protein
MSNATVLPVGTKVKRISNGATGEVIETNEAELATLSDRFKQLWKPRRRIKWDGGGPRTWISVKDLFNITPKKNELMCVICGSPTNVSPDELDTCNPVCSEKCNEIYVKSL